APQVVPPQGSPPGRQTGAPSTTLQTSGERQRTVAQGSGWSGTQVQTSGLGSKCVPALQVSVAGQTQMPPQSAPPWAGSQWSRGSAMHWPAPGQGNRARPPQKGPQAPAWATETPAVAAKQALPYVWWSQPQTGLKRSVQAWGSGRQAPGPPQVPGLWS